MRSHEKKKIGLIDVDSHRFPNLPLMKLSAWHKQQGDSVEWYEPLFSGHMDRVYMSKVFSFTPDYAYNIDADEVVRGGSGTTLRAAKELGRSSYGFEISKEMYRRAKEEMLSDSYVYIKEQIPDQMNLFDMEGFG